jgi:hypothetical protein
MVEDVRLSEKVLNHIEVGHKNFSSRYVMIRLVRGMHYRKGQDYILGTNTFWAGYTKREYFGDADIQWIEVVADHSKYPKDWTNKQVAIGLGGTMLGGLFGGVLGLALSGAEFFRTVRYDVHIMVFLRRPLRSGARTIELSISNPKILMHFKELQEKLKWERDRSIDRKKRDEIERSLGIVTK